MALELFGFFDLGWHCGERDESWGRRCAVGDVWRF